VTRWPGRATCPRTGGSATTCASASSLSSSEPVVLKNRPLAKLFVTSGWSQRELAEHLGKRWGENVSQQWLSYHLCFGRFLSFFTTSGGEESSPGAHFKLSQDLTEWTFRGYWEATEAGGNFGGQLAGSEAAVADEKRRFGEIAWAARSGALAGPQGTGRVTGRLPLPPWPCAPGTGPECRPARSGWPTPSRRERRMPWRNEKCPSRASWARGQGPGRLRRAALPAGGLAQWGRATARSRTGPAAEGRANLAHPCGPARTAATQPALPEPALTKRTSAQQRLNGRTWAQPNGRNATQPGSAWANGSSHA
jgi:hypothetical protein